MYTLDPLAASLRDLIRTEKIPDNLFMPVVSLQSGKVRQSGVDSFVDHVIGSSSIPLMVEPRVSRVWAQGQLESRQGRRMVIRHSDVPGMADSRCQLRFARNTTVRCVRVTTHFQQDFGTWLSHFDVEASTEKQLEPLTPGTGIEFSSMHQLVDGGVVDNLPLQTAYNIWFRSTAPGREPVDSIFVLTTGQTIEPEVGSAPIEGAIEIVKRTFEILWKAHYESNRELFNLLLDEMKALSDDLGQTWRWISAAKKWRDNLRTNLGEVRFAQLEQSIGSAFPQDEPSFVGLKTMAELQGKLPEVVLIDPERRIFEDLMDVKIDKIRDALAEGCAVAAQMYVGGQMTAKGQWLHDSNRRDKSLEEPACRAML